MSTIKFLLHTTIVLAVITLSTGCATKGPNIITKGEAFPKMYAEAPRSILILPPINESPDVEAKGYYLTTTEELFAQWGYYVFPTEITAEIMKQQGVYDTEVLYDADARKFHEYFGADAVLFARIKEWHVNYVVLASKLTVNVEAEIRSTKTNEKLWSRASKVVVDLSGGDGGQQGLAGLLVKAVITAINTAAADYVKYAKVANGRIIYTVPFGPYSPRYMNDQAVKIYEQKPSS